MDGMRRFLVAAVLALVAPIASAINIAHNQLGANNAVSSSCDQSAAVVTTTITTGGNTVQINISALAFRRSSQSFTYWGFKIWRDSTQLFDSQQSGQTSVAAGDSVASWVSYDTPSAGTHTYKLAVCVNPGGTGTAWTGTQITVWELM